MDNDAFMVKRLCDGITLNLGDACVYNCSFCYVPAQMRKLDHTIIKAYNETQSANGAAPRSFEQVVIRRRNALNLLRDQLLKPNGIARYGDSDDNRMVYSSTLVDAAGNFELLRETAEACNLILQHTHWQLRLLSKSNLLHHLYKDNMIPMRFRKRMVLGFSTGTPDDKVARAIEGGTPRVSARIKSLKWLQNQGYRTFGMICPSLPQLDYQDFSARACAMIDTAKCEHVWAEVINVRGESFTRTYDALITAGLPEEASRLLSVCGAGSRDRWEHYARETFLAHAVNIPPAKLRYLQYVTPDSASWWFNRRNLGAVCLGKASPEYGKSR